MKRMEILGALLGLALLAGCGDDFLNEEMLLGDESKLRPLAVVCEPAEASPGDTVTVTLVYWDPTPDETTVRWRVALDYDAGLYGASPVERDHVDIDAPSPVDTGDGFMRQTFAWVVPQTVLQNASAIPEDLDQEPWRSLSQLVAPGRTLTRQELDQALGELTPQDLESLPADEREAVWGLADLFACQIRFRAQLRNDIVVDVTRNFTVRYSRDLATPNVNENTRPVEWRLLAIAADDVDIDDLDRYEGQTTFYPMLTPEGEPQLVEVPAHADWTYYLVTDFAGQTYTSPFSGDERFSELCEYRWYTFRRDDGERGYPLLRSDDGDETEMWDLDEQVRLVPPEGVGSQFRVYACLRDHRPEWSGSQGSPGAALGYSEIRFLPE